MRATAVVLTDHVRERAAERWPSLDGAAIVAEVADAHAAGRFAKSLRHRYADTGWRRVYAGRSARFAWTPEGRVYVVARSRSAATGSTVVIVLTVFDSAARFRLRRVDAAQAGPREAVARV